MKHYSKMLIMIMLTAAMTLGMINTVWADSTAGDKTVSGLGTGTISNPESGNGGWNKVYFGSKEDPIKFNVLQVGETHFGGTTLLLDCENDLTEKRFHSESYGGTFWKNSEIRSWLNGDDFKGTRFTTAEISAIAESKKSSAASDYDGNGTTYALFADMSGDKIFLLDAKEVTNTNYGFANSDSSSSTREKSSESKPKYYWWTRSAKNQSIGNKAQTCIVTNWGGFDYRSNETSTVGVSPALNIDMDDIVFSTEVEDGVYKLTVVDEDMTVSDVSAIEDGRVLSCEYSTGGDNADNINRISVVMTDGTWDAENGGWSSGASLEYYGELDESNSFTVPDGFDTDWNMYLIAEQVNDGNATDYASAPVKIEHVRMNNIQVVILNSDQNMSGTETEVSYSAEIDTNTASEGDIVCFSLRPEEGSGTADKAVIKVMSDGKVIGEFTLKERDGVFKGAFIMPSSKVTVTAELVTDNADEGRKDISSWTVVGIEDLIYTGKPLKQQNVVVYSGDEYADFKIRYRNNLNTGTAAITIIGTGDYTGTIEKTFRILKANNKITCNTAKIKVKYKKKKSFRLSAADKANATKKYKLAYVPKKAKKYIKVSNKGIVTVKKGLKKGTYRIRVDITGAKTQNYKGTTKTVTFKVIVK